MRREYSAMTTSIDDQVGALMDSLQRSGQFDNTIVILTADHGDHLGAQGRRRGRPHLCRLPGERSWLLGRVSTTVV